MNQHLKALIGFVLLHSVLVAGLAGQEEVRPASAMFNGHVGVPRPTVDMPPFVQAPPGQLTLWADFAHATKDRVPLYLVNRTETPQSFPSQDNDLYIKLEYKNPTGKWTRAQAHLSSWCGNSYYSVNLPPGQFFEFNGYSATQGKIYPVRYASVESKGLISNEGQGVISETDLLDAGKDSISASKIPNAINSCIESQRGRLDDRDFDWGKAAVAMRLLKLMERNEASLDRVRNLMKVLDAQPAAASAGEARAAAAELFSYTWPTEIASDALLDRCIQAATADKQNSLKIGTLEGQPKLLWSLLAELLGRESRWSSHTHPKPSELTKLKPVLMAAAKLILDGSKELGYSAAAVLGNGRIADECITTSQFEEWLLLPNPVMQRVAAQALARRTQWKRLSHLGMTLAPEGQIMVLHTLAYAGVDQFRGHASARQPDFNGEHTFWEHCMKTQPLEAAAALWSYDFQQVQNPFNRIVHDPLHDYLIKEAEKAAKIDTSYDLGPSAQKLIAAVRMLGSWRMTEDIPVFKLLLKHPGTNAGAGLVIRRFAREALIMQGEPVPSE